VTDAEEVLARSNVAPVVRVGDTSGEQAFVRMIADGHIERMRDDGRELDARRAESDAGLLA
jgi:hypothetical protein